MTARSRAVLASAAILLVVAGCSKNPNYPSEVSGTVRYNGQPLKGGSIIFHSTDGSVHPATIQADGSYGLSDMPSGDMTVTVDTEMLIDKKANQDSTEYGQGDKREPGYNPPGLPRDPAPAAPRTGPASMSRSPSSTRTPPRRASRRR